MKNQLHNSNFDDIQICRVPSHTSISTTTGKNYEINTFKETILYKNIALY